MKKEIITQAIKDGKYALDMVKEAVKKTDSAENLSASAGLIGIFIRNISQKSANQAVEHASRTVGIFNEKLISLGMTDGISASADAESRLDDVLFVSAEASMLANNTAIRQRFTDVIPKIEEALAELEKMEKQAE